MTSVVFDQPGFEVIPPVVPGDRLGELLSLNDIGAPPETRFGRLTALAKDIFGVPTSRVTLIDRENQSVRSADDAEVTEIPLGVSFCRHTVAGEETLVVEDASVDPRFADHPHVVGDAHVRFYAGAALRSADGQPIGSICVMDVVPRTVTERERVILGRLAGIAQHELANHEIIEEAASLRHSEARHLASFMQSPIGMAIVSLSPQRRGVILEANEALVEMWGTTEAEALGRPISEMVHPEDTWMLLEGTQAAGAGEVRQLDREVRLQRTDGKVLWARIRARRVEDDDAEAYGIVHVTDITARRDYEDELARLALHDPLTGLANRRLLTERLEFALRSLERHHGTVAVLYLDFDHFKQVNDTYGHEAGDNLIVEAARRLGSTVRSIDTAGRFGGDEFVIVCPELADRNAARGVGERIQKSFLAPIDVGPAEVTLTISGGIAVTDDPGADPAKLLSAADEALYRAKQSGRNRFELASST